MTGGAPAARRGGAEVRIERLTLRVGGIGSGGAALLARLVAEGLAEAEVDWTPARNRALRLELNAAAPAEPARLASRVVDALMAELAREAS
jgi:hypothetical protein